MTNNRKRKKELTNRIIIAVAAVAAVIVIAAVAVVMLRTGKGAEEVSNTAVQGGLDSESGSDAASENGGYAEVEPGVFVNSSGEILDDSAIRELAEGENPEDIEVQVKASADYVEPGKGTLNINKIQGFTTKSDGSASNTAPDQTDMDQSEGALENTETDNGIVLSDANLAAESVGSYTGSFLEDGSDTPISNVAAVLITNNSSQMLQIAQITFQVNDSETASFKVTNLPAGTSALVLEQNRREYKDGDDYSYGDTASAYIDTPSLESDKFDVVMEKGKVVLNNKTDQSYSKVYVYYKYVQLGGAYKGGITYRTPVENVPANGSAEAVAGHMNPDSTQIVDVQVVE